MATPAATASPAPEGGASFGTKQYRGYVLLLLTGVYTLNFIDRSLLGVIAQPIIEEFGLSDTQYGFLNGPPFALFYALMGIPIAMMADRYNRVAIIATCICIWSVMAALCGLANSFVFLLVCRVGVAIGEAGGTPPANSVIADYFKPKSRANALGIYAMGVTIGTALANGFGGPISTLTGPAFGSWLDGVGLAAVSGLFDWENIEGWRIAFVVIGAPGVLVGLLLAFTIKEPPRGFSDPPGKQRVEKASISESLKELGSKPTFWAMSLGAALVAFVGYGHFGFQAPMAQRVADIGRGEFALQFGVPLALISALGTFLGGWLTERLSGRHPTAVCWIPATGLLISIPLYTIAFWQIDQNEQLSRIVWGLAVATHYAYLGSQYTIGQGVVSQRSRASAIAILLFIVALVGNGLGPQFVGIMSDIFMSMHISAAGMGDVLTNDICRSPDLSALTAEQQNVCQAAYGEGVRRSLMVTTLFFIPAAAGFLLAARTYKRDVVARPV